METPRPTNGFGKHTLMNGSNLSIHAVQLASTSIIMIPPINMSFSIKLNQSNFFHLKEKLSLISRYGMTKIIDFNIAIPPPFLSQSQVPNPRFKSWMGLAWVMDLPL